MVIKYIVCLFVISWHINLLGLSNAKPNPNFQKGCCGTI